MKAQITNIQKSVAVGVMAVAILFGMATNASIANAQSQQTTQYQGMTTAEVIKLLQQAMQEVENLRSQINNTKQPASSATTNQTIAVGEQVRVTNALNVRDNAGVQSAKIGFVSQGATAYVVDGPQYVGNYKWWKIQYNDNNGQGNGEQGWVANSWLELVNGVTDSRNDDNQDNAQYQGLTAKQIVATKQKTQDKNQQSQNVDKKFASCDLNINKKSMYVGEKASLSWNFDNAVEGSLTYPGGWTDTNFTKIFNEVGGFTISRDTLGVNTYTLKVVGQDGKTKTCKDSIEILEINDGDSQNNDDSQDVVVKDQISGPLSCDLNINKKSISEGGQATLSWNFDNAVEGSLTYPGGWTDTNFVENHNETGSFGIAPSEVGKNTYTLKLVGQDGKTKTCKDSIKLLESDNSSNQDNNSSQDDNSQDNQTTNLVSCELKIDKQSMYEGEKASLSWNFDNAVEGSLTYPGGWTDTSFVETYNETGGFYISPSTLGLNTYKLELVGEDGSKDACKDSIEVLQGNNVNGQVQGVSITNTEAQLTSVLIGIKNILSSL